MSGDVVERLRLGAWEAQRRHGVNPESTIFGKAADLITSQAAEIERLAKERDEALLCQQDIAAGSDRSAIVARIIIAKNEAENRAETAERLLAEARAALEPFARYETADGEGLDDELFRIPDGHALLGNGIGDNWTPVVTVGDFRRARTLTNGGENGR